MNIPKPKIPNNPSCYQKFIEEKPVCSCLADAARFASLILKTIEHKMIPWPEDVVDDLREVAKMTINLFNDAVVDFENTDCRKEVAIVISKWSEIGISPFTAKLLTASDEENKVFQDALYRALKKLEGNKQ